YVDSQENDFFERYRAFSKYGSLYEASLDSFRSKSSLKKSMDENRDFIHEHKNDYEYNDSVKARISENEKIDQILENIAKYEKTYGDNPCLGVTFIADYSDQHLYEFFISRDNSANLFEIQEILLNYIVEDFKNSGIKKLSSYSQIPNAQKLNIIGQYISEI
nr:hypothetical protein [Erysipelotrichaceae bacterium]